MLLCNSGTCAQTELGKHQCKQSRLEIWQRGVDTDQFNPRFRSREQRSNMTNGNPDAPLLVHVGRLGAGALPDAPCAALRRPRNAASGSCPDPVSSQVLVAVHNSTHASIGTVTGGDNLCATAPSLVIRL